MAYHFGNQTLGEVAQDDTIDELDSCAYSLLAALFSIVEPTLHNKLRTWYSSKRGKKSDIEKAHRDFKDAKVDGSAVLKEILPKFGQSPKVAPRFQNAKISFLFQQALAGETKDFFEACCSIMAHLDMIDMPGLQCTAVIRDSERNLYITGNGLWTSAGAIRASQEAEDEDGDGLPSAVDEPWFSSWGSFWSALNTVTGDMLTEYNLRSIKYVNPETGDFGGKFHAEMQLLDFMIEEGIVPERGYMGVSKPCCQYCKNWLLQAGIKFWNEHGVKGGDPNDQVQPPYALYKIADMQEYKKKVKQVRFYGLRM